MKKLIAIFLALLLLCGCQPTPTDPTGTQSGEG